MRGKRLLSYLALSILVVPALALSAGKDEAAATAPEIMRDPFWPVGYKPRPKVQQQELPESVIKWPKLQIKGTVKKPGGSHMAHIGGVGWVETGDTFSITQAGVVYRWTINKISKKGITHTKLDVRPVRGHAPMSNIRRE